MIIVNPRDWRALSHGDELQQRAFEVLKSNAVFERLAEFDPAHVSTIGNGLAIDTSDIDIVCSYASGEYFERVVRDAFGSCMDFSVSRVTVRGIEAVVANFRDTLEVEIYASATPTEQQLGYRHYLITVRLLMLAGEALATAVRERKLRGFKTEPALAAILGLEGDPYTALLELEQLSDRQVMALLRGACLSSAGNV